MKKIVITSALTAIITAVVISFAQESSYMSTAPTPGGSSERYEVMGAQFKGSMLISNKTADYDESCIIRVDKFTGQVWLLQFRSDSNGILQRTWEAVKN